MTQRVCSLFTLYLSLATLSDSRGHAQGYHAQDDWNYLCALQGSVHTRHLPPSTNHQPDSPNAATREALCRVTWTQSHASQLVSFPSPFCKLPCTHIHTATVFFVFNSAEDEGRFDSISSSILSELTLILVHSHCSQIREMNLAHGATIQSWSKTNVLLGG